jgi:ABC transporter substrate binding protein
VSFLTVNPGFYFHNKPLPLDICFCGGWGLMPYAVGFNNLDQRAATYIDKIIKVRKPADLTIEQAIKFEFVVNLKAAKKIGLAIAPNALVRAVRVIK